MTSRVLYDSNFVTSNCTLEYDETTNLDTTKGTYLTNYLVGVVGLTAAWIMIQKLKSNWLVLYFCTIAATYSLAGFGHQYIQTTEDPRKSTIETLTHVLVLSALMTLQFSVVSRKKLRISLILVFSFMVFLTLLFESLIFLSAYIMISYFLLSFHYLAHARDYYAAVGCFLYCVGQTVQASLRQACGDDGYPTCWKDCPLKNPMKFNHNALYHIIVAVSLVFQAAGNYSLDVTGKESARSKIDEMPLEISASQEDIP